MKHRHSRLRKLVVRCIQGIFIAATLVSLCLYITHIGRAYSIHRRRHLQEYQHNLDESVRRFEFFGTSNLKVTTSIKYVGNNTTKASPSKARKVFLTIGIPTVCRETGSYINETVRSLLETLTEEELNQIVVIVLLSDRRETCRDTVRQQLSKSYHKYIEDGVIDIIKVPESYYPSFDRLKRTYNDSEERVRWRSKQNLDYSYLMFYGQDKAHYYLQLEDDVTAGTHYLAKIKTYIQNVKKPWAMLEFSALGFIGKLFHSEDVGKLANLLKTFYNEQPCDFLVFSFLNLMLQRDRFVRIPTLFQHNGLHSSLPKLLRNVSDKYFSSNAKHYHGDNPPASIYTTLPTWQNFKPQYPYSPTENDVFWSNNPYPGATYTLLFKKPQSLQRVVILTGLNDKHKDKLSAGIVEISDTVVSVLEDSVICSGFVLVGQFEHGAMDANTTQITTKTKCLKLTVTKRQNTWLVIREVAVFLKHE